MDAPEATPHDVLTQMGWVRELARGLVRSAAEADDVAQEVWLAASGDAPRSSASMRAWLAAITRNVVLSRSRAESRRRVREVAAARVEDRSSEDDVLVRAETCRRVVAAVMALDEPYRSTVLHRYLDAWSSAEIAAREGIAEAAVRKRLSRALQRLRAALDVEFEGGREAWMGALVEVGRTRPRAPASPIAPVLGGVVAMKKALMLSMGVLLVACAMWLSPIGRRWLDTDRAAPADAPVAGEIPEPRHSGSSTVPEKSLAAARSAITGDAAPDSLSVAGVVLNLAHPDTDQPPTPAVGIAVELALPPLGSSQHVAATASTDHEGRFQVVLDGLADREQGWGFATLSIAGDERYRPKRQNLTIRKTHKSARPEPAGSRAAQNEIAIGVPLSDVRLERAMHGDLAGVVVDDDDKPLANVAVELGNAAFFGYEEASTEPGRELITDANGAFVFRNVHAANSFYPGSPALAARMSGMRVIPSGSPSILPQGGWSDTRIRLIATGGRVAVRVRDRSGRPEAGVAVGIGISSAEPNARFESWNSGADASAIRGKTDAEGRVVFDDVWIGKRLELRVNAKRESWTRERAQAGRIDLEIADLGEYLRAAAEKTLELDVVLPEIVRLRGRVVDARGAGVPQANVSLRAIGPGAVGSSHRSAITTDAGGGFELELARPPGDLQLQLVAYTGPESMWDVLEFLDNRVERSVGRRTLTISPDGPAEMFVELEVAPALTISGTVKDADGTPCAGGVVAIPAGGFEGDYSRGSAGHLDEQGRFEIAGLLPGAYDLDVRPERNHIFTDCLLSHRFTDIAAGSSALDLVLRDDRAVDVEIVARAADGKLALLTVVTGIFHPYSARDSSGHVSERERSFDGTSGWPRGATLSFGGQTGGRDAEGTTGFLHLRGELPVQRCKPMNAGWYFLGIDATDAEGEHYHACGTGLVYLAPGSYRFQFDLVRQARIEGRIANADPNADLWAGLVTRAGRAVQVLRTSRHLDDVVPIGSDGRFALDGAPVGEFRLRFGSERQLRGGEFIHELPVVVSRANNTPLVVRLP